MRFTTAGMELDALHALVDAAAQEMKSKLTNQYCKGYRGWDDSQKVPSQTLKELLLTNLGEGDYVDVMNIAAMLWNRQQPDFHPCNTVTTMKE